MPIGTSRRRAVIVGVSNYTETGWPSLQFADNDAVRLARVLIDRGGFCAEDVALFCDSPVEGASLVARAPVQSDILSAIQSSADSAEPGDLVLFFFAGHGNEITHEPYLLTNDTRQNVIKDTALRLNRVREILDASKAGCTVRLFDACRTSLSGERGPSPAMEPEFEKALLQVPTGSVAFSACSSGESAREHPNLRHGVFSYYLCQGLEGMAANDSGEVTFERLVDYVKISVANECKGRFIQTPYFKGELAGPLVLARHAPVTAAVASESPIVTPMEEFQGTLLEFLGAREVRVLQADVTNEEGFKRLAKHVMELVETELTKLNGPAFAVSAPAPTVLPALSSGAHQAFMADVAKSGFGPIYYADDLPARRLNLASKHACVPTCSVTVAVARFSYLFWIWLSAVPQPHHRSVFKALEPKLIQDYRVLPARDAEDDKKVIGAINYLMERLAEAMRTWNQQCTSEIESQMQRVREDGHLQE